MFKEALRDDGSDEQVRWAMAQQLQALRDEADAACEEVSPYKRVQNSTWTSRL